MSQRGDGDNDGDGESLELYPVKVWFVPPDYNPPTGGEPDPPETHTESSPVITSVVIKRSSP